MRMPMQYMTYMCMIMCMCMHVYVYLRCAGNGCAVPISDEALTNFWDAETETLLPGSPCEGSGGRCEPAAPSFTCRLTESTLKRAACVRGCRYRLGGPEPCDVPLSFLCRVLIVLIVLFGSLNAFPL